MHTITGLRKALGLTTANQVRNRIEAVRDVLEPHLRRGPNNQILLTDEGLAVLRQLQELYDSGLRMNEASSILRASSLSMPLTATSEPSGFTSHPATPDASRGAATRALEEEITFLRTRVVDLERHLLPSPTARADERPWWLSLREDLDVA